jgi:O-antigen/teichoic acid export membrane protein
MMKLKQKAHDALRKSEKFFKTDMVYLARGGFWLGLGQMAASFSSFLLAIAFAHYVSKEIYGNYKYILSLASILGAFSLTGISSAVLQAVSRGYEGALRQGFKINLRWSIFIFIGALCAGAYYMVNGNASLGVSFFIIGIFSPIFNSAQLYISFLNGKRDFKTITTLGLWQDFVPIFCLVATIIFTNNVVLIVLVYFLSNTLVAFVLYRKTLRRYNPHYAVQETSLSYSKHLSFMNILGGIGDKIDSVLIFHFSGAVALSIYAFATAIPNQIIGLFRTVGLLAIPKYTEGNKELIKREMPAKVLRFMSVLVVAIIGYYFLAPYAYNFFFPQYSESIPYSRLYAVVMIFASGVLPMSLIEARMAIKERYIVVVLSNVTRIILMSVLVIPYGIWGILWAQIITKSIVLTMQMILVWRI